MRNGMSLQEIVEEALDEWVQRFPKHPSWPSHIGRLTGGTIAIGPRSSASV
jgi:hypothetical protein